MVHPSRDPSDAFRANSRTQQGIAITNIKSNDIYLSKSGKPCVAVLATRDPLAFAFFFFSSRRERMTKVYVGRLPASLLESDIKELFETHGEIQSIDLKQGGYAFITFDSLDGATAAGTSTQLIHLPSYALFKQ